MSGKFVVVEGLNRVGKTTILNAVMQMADEELQERLHYSKGFTHDTTWGRWISSRPHSSAYYLDLAAKTARIIKPKLATDKIVLQDRYVQSVDTYLPDSEWIHNRLFRKLCTPFLLQPGFYVHVTASIDEIVDRLAEDKDEYRRGLRQHPQSMIERERKYKQVWEQFTCPKHLIDTTGRTAERCAEELLEFLHRNVYGKNED